ncbi:MAG: hypothetical protein JNL30_09875 [Rubrivivax sp.]|nr:hypothetical protein [Rubrivivax sp.]
MAALGVVAAVAAGALAAAGSAAAQTSMTQCRAALAPAADARLRLCEVHTGCRNVVRVIDGCPALKAFLDLLPANGAPMDDSTLRRTLIEAGVPPNGLPSCTTEFNRALCRNFLNLEDASGETGAGPSRRAQFDAAMRQLVEQQEQARVPAEQHRTAELRLEACAAARPGPERDGPCREAAEAVQACEVFRAQWAQRRDVLLVDAHRLNRPDATATLRALEIPPCAQTLPGTTLTPQQALSAAVADVPEGPGGGAAGISGPGATPVPERERTPPPPGPRADGGAECKAALRRMEERFEALQRRRPPQPDRLSSQQVEIYMLTEQVGVLERLCHGQREYDFLRPTQDRLARALQECRGSAPNPINDCVPRVAW